MLHEAAQNALLGYARAVLTAAVGGGEAPPAPTGEPFDRPAGVFVTLRRGAELRGCLGRVTADTPLGRLVGDMAVAAGRHDPRFPPVRQVEVKALTIEVSVLQNPVPAAWDQVQPGQHGVIVRRGRRHGVLLPQVAREHGWTREQLLEAACLKASLPPTGWRDPGTSIELFEAQVFAQ